MTKPVTRKMAVDCLLYRFMALGGIPCGICMAPLNPGDDVQFDHVQAIVHTGPHIYQNIRPVHTECHKKKTARDIAANAKIKRIRGETKQGPKRAIPSRPFQNLSRAEIKKAIAKGKIHGPV